MSQKKQYIGNKEIVSMRELDVRTPKGATVLEVTYKSGEVEKMSHPRFNVVVKDKSTDLETVRQTLIKFLGDEMYKILVEHDLRVDEIDPLFNAVVGMINSASILATNKLWGVDHSDKRSLIMINNILIKEYDKENNDGASPNGGGTTSEDKK
jgi:hypothetical protein